MNRLLSLSITYLILALTLLSPAFGQSDEPQSLKEALVTRYMLENLSNFHYAPKELDDDLSGKIYKEFLKELDPNKIYLLKSDINMLESYRTLIDNELRNINLGFLKQSTILLKHRVNQIKGFYPNLITKPFNFEKNETIETDPEKIQYCETLDELKERWRKHLKYQTLINYLNLTADKRPTGDSLENIKITFDKKTEKKARKKTRKSIGLSLNRIVDNLDELFNVYMDVIANIYDPHTAYLPPQEKENFDINISGKLEGIGAVLSEEDGFIKVVRIIPGSASDRQGDLEENDLILKVAENTAEPLDLVAMRVKDAVKYIRGKKGTEVRLTVKKTDGRIQVIPIIRDIVVIEETYAKSWILKNDKFKERYGYIRLPSFYRDFKNSKGRNATDDIRKALENFKNKKIQGIILDLRNNGGGSLEDAIQVAGLFIKSGPVVQVKGRRQNPRVHRDKDRDILYDGPLIVIINKFSASASEIVSAALQDYNRAIIVGSSHSFGKGTVQTMINLDYNMDKLLKLKLRNVSSLGSLKLTFQNFYRINGNAIQYAGVSSDIAFPDLFQYRDVGERELEYSLPSSTLDALNYDAWERREDTIKKLKTKSLERISKSSNFKLIDDYSEKLKTRKEETLQPLRFENAFEEQFQLEKESKTYKDKQKSYEYLSIETVEGKESEKELKKETKQIKKDTYLEECTSILHDLISLK